VTGRHLQIAPLPSKVLGRKETEEWAAERRKTLSELVEREGLGHQLTLDERRAA
jgi:hypothetical protein